MNNFYKVLSIGSSSALALLLLGTSAHAQSVATEAYATDTRNQVVKSGTGLCWRTSQWTAAKAIAECDPDLVKRPEPMPLPPPPVPTPPRVGDTDGDGVPDHLDRCPTTPAGAKVDTTGCELDSDGDGVVDQMDRCPNTPAGAKVGATGCELDADGDGVVDRLDRCPNTPAGARVNPNGCEPDADGDGVVDRLDRCPNTVAGAKVDANGCELDSDRDGVVDRLDRCPDTKPGVRVDANGCEIEIISLKGVNFDTGSAKLTASSSATLNEAAATLARRGNVRVEVAGHTDNVGAADKNRTLSQRRAQAVVDYLVSKGANAANLSAKGYGPDQPVADNKTASGRAANRRVELRVMQ